MQREELLNLFNNKRGIEIGGLSKIFGDDGLLPIYNKVLCLDGCNFDTNTLWETGLKDGYNYHFSKDKLPGYQYICEASGLSYRVGESRYNFVISSNCLEHVANPLKAIKEFCKVLVDDGILLLVLPKKESNFDHKRNVTSYQHLCDDLVNEIDELDLTHLEEILELHDLSLDPPAGALEYFTIRSLNNYSNRALHHHVFDDELLSKMLAGLNISELYSEVTATDYIIAGRK